MDRYHNKYIIVFLLILINMILAIFSSQVYIIIMLCFTGFFEPATVSSKIYGVFIALAYLSSIIVINLLILRFSSFNKLKTIIICILCICALGVLSYKYEFFLWEYIFFLL